jgi:hypothetical protein
MKLHVARYKACDIHFMRNKTCMKSSMSMIMLSIYVKYADIIFAIVFHADGM